jgi:hypothetical protein
MEADGYRDHRTRDLLYDYIIKNPGATFQMLKTAFRLTDGTLRYHLDYLMKKRKVVQEKSGREKCYYSFIKKEYPYSDPSVRINREQERILEIVASEPGIKLSDLKARSGLKDDIFDYNMKRLRKMKLLWKVKGIEGPGYEVVTKERLSDEVFLRTVNKFLDGEIDKGQMMTILRRLNDNVDDERG